MSSRFTDSAFWEKIKYFAKTAGRALIEHSLILFHTLKDSDTPAWAKGAIVSALAYFISPLDLIPDFFPVVGYTDDFAAIIAAISAVAMHVKPEHRIKAADAVTRIFGPGKDS
jgi:uncharacterized membrane protein YkvA (DUF1232 family)